jgi:hypothetical protein
VVSEDNGIFDDQKWPLALLDVDWEKEPDDTNWRFRFHRFREHFEDVKLRHPEWMAPWERCMYLERGPQPPVKYRPRRPSLLARLFVAN